MTHRSPRLPKPLTPGQFVDKVEAARKHYAEKLRQKTIALGLQLQRKEREKIEELLSRVPEDDRDRARRMLAAHAED